MTSPLQPGDPAPVFTAIAVGGSYGAGTPVTLSQFLGRTVILYFYPKDDTPGCTTQACALRDAWPTLEGKAEIFGVSIDSAPSHAKFIAKHQLPFPILVDDQRTLVSAYQVWVEKSMYGKKYMGTERTTVVIDPEGKIQAVHRKVKPADHTDLLTKALARV